MSNSTNTLAILDFTDDDSASHIRVEVHEDVAHFLVKDVCSALDLTNSGEAVKGLDSDELTSVVVMSGGQRREMLAVTESGLYALIFKSRKPEAQRFRKWVTSVVLPALRRRMQCGGLTEEVLALLPPRGRRALLQDELEKLERQTQFIRRQADMALVIPGQMTVHQWLLLQGEETPKGGVIANLSGQCSRLARARGLEIGEAKVIEHCGQIVRLTRTAKTFEEEILKEVCGQAAA